MFFSDFINNLAFFLLILITMLAVKNEEKHMEISDDDKFLLIDCVKAEPKIWDVANRDYKKRDKSSEWKKVCADMIESTGRQFDGFFLP
jgi:hypothetical protein